MIQFILTNPNERNDKYHINEPELGRNNHSFIYKINFLEEQIIPSPKKIELLDQKPLIFHKIFELKVSGAFTNSNDIEMLQDFYKLSEPYWNLTEFVSKMEERLNEFGEIQNKNLKIEFEQINDKINGDSNQDDNQLNEKLSRFVPNKFRSQAYSLIITQDSIEITAWTKTGAYYGFLSLAHLIRANNLNMIIYDKAQNILDSNLKMFNSIDDFILLPSCQIFDYPDFEFRGLEDDISRGQRPTIDHFKEFIRFLSNLKLNAEVLYIEDMFKFEELPNGDKIGVGRNPLTKEEIRELEDYAQEYFVEIQPAVEMFGHMDNILTLPEFRKYGEFPGAQCFDISSEETKELVDKMLKELCNAFRSPMFHLVCDESFDFGLWNSRDYVNSLGKGGKDGKSIALAEWYLFLVDTVKKYGKDIAGFAHDVIVHYPKTMKLVKDKIKLIHFWNYADKKSYPVISKLIKNGFEVAAVPTTFDWSRHYPYSDYAEKNTIYMAKDGLKRGAKFLVTTKFGDFFNENLRENIRYGLVIEAQASWNVFSRLIWDDEEKLDCLRLKIAFTRFYFGTNEKISNDIIHIMDVLNKQNDVLPRFPNGMINRFWLDPYTREISKKERKYLNRFINESHDCLIKLHQIETSYLANRGDMSNNGEIAKSLADYNKAKIKNSFHFEYLKLALKFSLHYATKLLTAEAVWQNKTEIIQNSLPYLRNLSNLELIPDFKDIKIDSIKDLTALFSWLITDIMEIKELYKKLWLLQNVPEGLEYPLHRFDILRWYYEHSQEVLSHLNEKEKIDIKNIRKQLDLQLRSEWIWQPGIRSNCYWGNRKPQYFFKEFKTRDSSSQGDFPNTTKSKDITTIKKAIIQGIANNYMKIYLDGEFVGEVYSRFSLSQLPMAKSVQVFDVTSILKSKSKDNNPTDAVAENYHNISIEAWNYANGIGGINIILHIEYENQDSEDIISDSSWYYSPNKIVEKIDQNDLINLKHARSFGRPPLAWNGPISRPNWEKNWKSEISYVFGMRNYVETSIITVTGDFLFKLLFWIVPFGMRLMGTDLFGYRKI